MKRLSNTEAELKESVAYKKILLNVINKYSETPQLSTDLLVASMLCRRSMPLTFAFCYKTKAGRYA